MVEKECRRGRLRPQKETEKDVRGEEEEVEEKALGKHAADPSRTRWSVPERAC